MKLVKILFVSQYFLILWETTFIIDFPKPSIYHYIFSIFIKSLFDSLIMNFSLKVEFILCIMCTSHKVNWQWWIQAELTKLDCLCDYIPVLRKFILSICWVEISLDYKICTFIDFSLYLTYHLTTYIILNSLTSFPNI